MMKIKIILVALALSLIAGCGDSPPQDISAGDAVLGSAAGMVQEDETLGLDEAIGGDWDFGPYRPRYYTMPGPFADLVGRDAYLGWFFSMDEEERESECIAVRFIREFGISQRQFSDVNEELLNSWLSRGNSPEESSAYEIYPVDLIYTFDNEAIDEFFLWENSPIPEERGVGYGTKRKKNVRTETAADIPAESSLDLR
ncbi:MAG: hypothetical protein FWG42_11195 [Clostridiales bacterium]|nr:hypothetical protein [Clostridiales bacterium]